MPYDVSSDARIRVTYTADSGGDYYNGLFPGENNPILAIVAGGDEEIDLEQVRDSYVGASDTTIYEENDNSNGGGDR